MTSLVAQMVKNPPAMWENLVRSLGQEDPPEKGMATHSSILAWRISWAEEPGGLQSIGLQSWTRLKQLGGSSSRYESVLVTQSYPSLCDFIDCSLPGSSVCGDPPGKNIGMGCHALLQGIFPNQGSNPGLPHCRQILYSLSQQGSPRVLEWVACPVSSGTSPPRNQTRVSCIAGRFFTS